MATKQIKIKVTKNQHGNFKGYVTGEPCFAMGSEEWYAKDWIARKLAQYPGAIFDKEKSCLEVQ